MRSVLLLVFLLVAAGSTASGQSCATLRNQLDCSAGQKRAAPAKPPEPKASQPTGGSKDLLTDGSAELEVSNRGTATTLQSRGIDSHGVVEFGFSGSNSRNCSRGGYALPCY